MTNLPDDSAMSVDKPRRRRRKDDDYHLLIESVSYEWKDADGVTHVTPAEGLPSELKAADGSPQLPPNHPAWRLVLEDFYQAGFQACSWEAYLLLWEKHYDEMLPLYQRWLAKGMPSISAKSED